MSPFHFLRLRVGVAREWGRRSESGITCDLLAARRLGGGTWS
ncbi:MAG: hypothetical protein ACOCUW_01570 [Gemmatimonadota bacterium]